MDFPTITFCNANGYNSNVVENPTAMKELFVSLNPILSRMIKVNMSLVSPLMKTQQDILYRTMSLRKEDHMLMALFRGNDIYINHPSDKQSHLDPLIAVAPGTTAYISMTKHQYKFLPKPYKSFGDDTCIDTDSPTFTNPLKYASSYSFDACIDECLSHHSTTNCRCKTSSDPDDLPYPYCTLEELFGCTFTYTALVYYNQTSQRELCHCHKPCRFFVYDTKLSYGAFPSNAVTDYMVRNNVVPSAEYARLSTLPCKRKYTPKFDRPRLSL
ncbi:acid-sensing ion channel 1-like [Haliotis rubra]|uniref:acid-sensing ion channel 1-like n=1 Tax=Haliotis rubra TaxID=36100 RepID=UPI001EE54B56|nr:acid-sensing ion channel 1-like [Haliotis rubra]